MQTLGHPMSIVRPVWSWVESTRAAFGFPTEPPPGVTIHPGQPRARRDLTFAVDPSSWPQFAGLGEETITPEARVSRAEAIQVPAVKRVRDLICGTLGSLPLNYLDRDFELQRHPLIEQPEAAVPRSVTMAHTFEDMLFEGVAWWRVVDREWAPEGQLGYPRRVRRLEPRTVQIRDDLKAYVRRDGSAQGSAWDYVDDRDLIRFHSPNDPLLVAGARAIRISLLLDRASKLYATTPMPSGYFRMDPEAAAPFIGAQEAEESDEDYEARFRTAVQDLILDPWTSARQRGVVGFVGGGLEFVPTQWSPVELGLGDRQQHAALEIARLAGVDPEDVGVSTTSRTYQNGDSRQRALIDMTLGAYMVAVQDRLSMGDVTPRGYMARFDVNGFLRSNEDQRVQTHERALAIGLYDLDYARRREELPPQSAARPAAVRPLRALTPAPQEEPPMAASGDATGPQFDAPPAHFGFETEEGRLAFEVDVERRTIFGLAVPYGVAARNGGRQYVFERGTLRWGDVGRVKLLICHDHSQAVGRAVELTEDDAGLWAKFQLDRSPEADRALMKAQDGTWDGLSIGLGHPSDCVFDRRQVNGRLVEVSRNAPLVEISLTPTPAFDNARVSAVAATADLPEGTAMTGTPGTETATAEPVAPAATAPLAFDMEALAQAVAAQITAQTAAAAPEGPEAVPVGGPVFVAEEGPYRFDADRGFISGGQFDFSGDLHAASKGDYAAQQRALAFMAEALTFDVDTTDAAAANPSRQRPDLYVDQRQFNYPLWSAVRKESLTDLTPMVLPKWSSDSGLVAAHTEGTEPAAGALALTSQTVTPAAVSGKVEITRELWDQAGSPRISNVIWQKMVQRWFEALEAKVVTVLDAASPTGITVTAGGGTTGQGIAAELGAAFAALQYIRGGFSMDTFAVQVDLYKGLAGALNDVGDPLFPILGPSNRNGTSAPRYASMNVHGVAAFPAHALAATGSVAASSYLFDRESVYAAASAPERLEWNFGATIQDTTNIPQLSHVTLGIWGYSVVAITDLTGVREVIYDPVA
jgi:HK97 family phage prohead protease